MFGICLVSLAWHDEHDNSIQCWCACTHFAAQAAHRRHLSDRPQWSAQPARIFAAENCGRTSNGPQWTPWRMTGCGHAGSAFWQSLAITTSLSTTSNASSGTWTPRTTWGSTQRCRRRTPWSTEMSTTTASTRVVVWQLDMVLEACLRMRCWGRLRKCSTPPTTVVGASTKPLLAGFNAKTVTKLRLSSSSLSWRPQRGTCTLALIDQFLQHTGSSLAKVLITCVSRTWPNLGGSAWSTPLSTPTNSSRCSTGGCPGLK